MVLPLTAFKFPSWFGDDLDFYSLLSLRVWTTFYVAQSKGKLALAQRERLLMCNKGKKVQNAKMDNIHFKKTVCVALRRI